MAEPTPRQKLEAEIASVRSTYDSMDDRITNATGDAQDRLIEYKTGCGNRLADLEQQLRSMPRD